MLATRRQDATLLLDLVSVACAMWEVNANCCGCRLKHGSGKWRGPSGENYEGQYEDDMKQGEGYLVLPDGER